MKKYLEQPAAFLFFKNLSGAEILILATFLLSGYYSNLQSVEFQPDETFWVASSVRFDKFLAGDFNSPVWNEPFVNYEVRPVPSYIVAISQRLGGVEANELPAYWDWELTNDQNISRGAMPSDNALWWSRLPMAAISAFSLLGIIFFLAKTHSRISAYVFALISFNDYFLLHLRRAMSEAPLILFTVLALYASYSLFIAVQENSKGKVVLWSAIAGIVGGAAGQSKLTGLACGGIPILAAIISIFKSAPTARCALRTFLIVAGIVTCASLLTFVGTYPFFYENTLYRTLGTFYFRNFVIEGQMQTYASQVILPGERISVLFQRILRYPIFLDSDGAARSLFPWINFLVVVFGAACSIFRVWKKGKDWERYVILLLGALTCATPMLLVPFDWDRYYLYPIFFGCIFFSIGIGQLLFVMCNSCKDMSAKYQFHTSG